MGAAAGGRGEKWETRDVGAARVQGSILHRQRLRVFCFRANASLEADEERHGLHSSSEEPSAPAPKLSSSRRDFSSSVAWRTTAARSNAAFFFLPHASAGRLAKQRRMRQQARDAARRGCRRNRLRRAEEARASEGARYQETIARLQQQLSSEQGPRPSTVSFRVDE